MTSRFLWTYSAAARFMLCSGLMTSIFFTPDAGKVYSMTRWGFFLFPLTMPLSCICCIFCNYYQCRKKLGIVNLLSVVDGIAGVILFSVILTPILEMAGNIVKHVFSEKKKQSIDIRVMLIKNSLIIRLKDNCRAFNPKDVQNLFEPEDITHNIGIRIISNMAKKMQYLNSFGLNVLTIEL